MDETTVTRGGGDSGLGNGLVVALVAVILLLIAGAFVVISRSGFGTTTTPDVPNVTVNTNAG